MRIYHSNLAKQLSQPLPGVWLIFGDEPWQKNDALDTIKLTAKNQGFDELIRFSNEDKFDFNRVLEEYQSLSLFSSQRIIEIDIGASKLDEKSTQILINLSEQIQHNPHNDVMLILHGAKLDANTSKKKWFKSLEKIGCYIPLYELEGKGLTIWLNQQCQKLNLKMDSQAQQMLIDFFVGNIPALSQELQKLTILFDQQFIRTDDLEQLLIKQAKFTPFQLIDALLVGDLSQCINMLSQLKQEGVVAAQLIWVFHKEILQLETMQLQQAKGVTLTELYKTYRIWEKKKPLYNSALKNMSLANIKLAKMRLAKTDILSKTSSDFNPYILLSDVCITLYHGQNLMPISLDYEYFG